MKQRTQLRAIGFALTGFTLWVISDALMKMAAEANLPPYEVVCFLGFFSALLMVLKTGAQGKIKTLWPVKPLPQCGRMLLSFGTAIANVVALKYLPLTLFYTAVFAAPMVIALLAAFLLRERLTWQRMTAIVIGFGGVVIAIDPAGITGGGWTGYIAAAAAVLCFAGNAVWVRVMTQSESVGSIVFFSGLVETILCGGLMFWHAVPIGIPILLILFGMGLFGVVGDFYYYTASRHAVAATVAQFHYTQIIAGAILGYIVWHEIPAPHTILGAAIITATGMYIAAHAHEAENRAAASLR